MRLGLKIGFKINDISAISRVLRHFFLNSSKSSRFNEKKNTFDDVIRAQSVAGSSRPARHYGPLGE